MTDKIDEILERMDERATETAERTAQEVAEETAERTADKVVQKYMQGDGPAVHTESRTSDWTEDEYQVGEGRAFKEALVAGYRAHRSGRKMDEAATYAEDKEFAKRFLGNDSDGGANVVPEILAEDVIPELYKRLVFDQLGVTQVPMATKKLPIGRQNQKAIASHVGEGTELPSNGAGFDQLELDAKKITGRADIANDWLRADPRVGMEFMFQDLMSAIAEKMELTALEGEGGANEPTGIAEQIHVDNQLEFLGSASATDYEEILDDVEKAVLAANIRPGDIDVLMGDQDFLGSRRLRTENGVLIYEGLRESTPSLVGKRTYRTNIIAEDRGVDTNESRIYMGDWSSVLFGILKQMEVEFSRENRFEFDETVLRGIAHYDTKLRRDSDLAYVQTDFNA